jgi:adenylosuccinate lyase
MTDMKPRNLALPGNPRYQPKVLQPIFGYDNLMSALAEVEIATLETLYEIGIMPHEDFAFLTPEVIERLKGIPTSAVDKLEREVTKHDVRAWVQLAQQIVHKKLARWIHVPLTSYDALDTARVLLYKHAHTDVIRPKARQVIALFTDRTVELSNVLQIGRTHGQHALPITVGFWFATILSRILTNLRQADAFAEGLVGKISGAVGAHNAQVGLGFAARCGDLPFEERVLGKLGLCSTPISTQILPPEPASYLMFSYLMLSGALGQFGRDCRQLMRPEIGEVGEPFENTQVGSSTMAQKRNPITFEGLEGNWFKTVAEFMKVVLTTISEHQRDLVGSGPMRDFPTIAVNVVLQLEALLRREKKIIDGQEVLSPPFLARITINSDACRSNFDRSKNTILAEPLYIEMQRAGYDGDAHHFVSHKAIPIVLRDKIPLLDAAEKAALEDPSAKQALASIERQTYQLLRSPEAYIGDAPKLAMRIAEDARRYLATV